LDRLGQPKVSGSEDLNIDIIQNQVQAYRSLSTHITALTDTLTVALTDGLIDGLTDDYITHTHTHVHIQIQCCLDELKNLENTRSSNWRLRLADKFLETIVDQFA
jgi:hypothetical protein